MQNFADESFTVSQFAQTLAKAWPQLWQNFAGSGLSNWQLAQTVKE
jgi:hypothetical protein